MKTRLHNKYYTTAKMFMDDLHLIVDNAKLYNQKSSSYYKCADNIEKFFMARSVEIMKEYIVSSNKQVKGVAFLIRCFHLHQLHTAGIEHHAYSLSHRLRREIVTEEHTYNSVGSVSLRNLTPDAAIVRTILHGLSLHVQ